MNKMLKVVASQGSRNKNIPTRPFPRSSPNSNKWQKGAAALAHRKNKADTQWITKHMDSGKDE